MNDAVQPPYEGSPLITCPVAVPFVKAKLKAGNVDVAAAEAVKVRDPVSVELIKGLISLVDMAIEIAVF